jgi:DNA (cytosine-5)-methyltransferase 3A
MLERDEIEKLQTLPEGYTKIVSKTDAHKMIGNGWTVEVIKHIFRNMNELS